MTSRFHVGDTVTFRREVVQRCGGDAAMAAFRARVTGLDERWAFLEDAAGGRRVYPLTNLCKVQANGLVLEIVRPLPRAA